MKTPHATPRDPQSHSRCFWAAVFIAATLSLAVPPAGWSYDPQSRGLMPNEVPQELKDIGIDEHAAGAAPGTTQPDPRAPLDADGHLQRAVRVRVSDQEVREHEELGGP